MSNTMTTQQAAQQWGVSVITVRAWIYGGKLRAVKTGRDWAIPADAQIPTDGRYVESPVRDRRKKEPVLRMRDVINKDSYDALTAAERRDILKMEQAKEYSGWGAYPGTCEAIIKQLPGDIWDRYTAQQIGEIMRISHDSYVAGRKSVDSEA